MRRLAKKFHRNYPGIRVVELAGADPRVVRAYVSVLCACSCACSNYTTDPNPGKNRSADQQKNDNS